MPTKCARWPLWASPGIDRVTATPAILSRAAADPFPGQFTRGQRVPRAILGFLVQYRFATHYLLPALTRDAVTRPRDSHTTSPSRLGSKFASVQTMPAPRRVDCLRGVAWSDRRAGWGIQLETVDFPRTRPVIGQLRQRALLSNRQDVARRIRLGARGARLCALYPCCWPRGGRISMSHYVSDGILWRLACVLGSSRERMFSSRRISRSSPVGEDEAHRTMDRDGFFQQRARCACDQWMPTKLHRRPPTRLTMASSSGVWGRSEPASAVVLQPIFSSCPCPL